MKTAKEELVRKIRELEIGNDQLKADLSDKEKWIRLIADHFSRGSKGYTVLERLRDEGEPFQNLLNALSSPPPSFRQHSGTSNGLRDSDSEDLMETDDEVSPKWTSVTRNESTVHHLMALYFAWVHPVHMFFSERHFMASFRNHDDTYCSSALVNAICAVGCCYVVDKSGNQSSVRTLGDRFTQQVWAQLKTERTMTPVSVVTYAIMFLVELSNGQARTAFTHLRLAVEALRDVDMEDWSEEAFEITYSGIHSLSMQVWGMIKFISSYANSPCSNWAALTYQKPPASMSFNTAVFEHVELDRPDQYWQFYRFSRDAGVQDTPSHAIETARELAKLSLINFKTITAWCAGTGKMTAKLVLNLYREYLAWKNNLSHELSKVDSASSQELLPYILLLQ